MHTAIVLGLVATAVAQGGGVTWRSEGDLQARSGEVAKLCGSRDDGLNLPLKKVPLRAELPLDFDAREKWGSMCKSVTEVRDQAGCGGCWAFGAAEAMTDRTCIHSKGAQQPHISALEIISCDKDNSYGCNGGDTVAAWKWWVDQGVVTGGSFNNDTDGGCAPFPFPRCDHLGIVGKYPKCETDYTPYCPFTCTDAAKSNKDAFKHFGATAYQLPSDEAAIRQEIMDNGPVEASFTVYQDFTTYTSGVYVHSNGTRLGGHAIKLIGWGQLNSSTASDGHPTPYWIVANSWNEDWGEEGFFRILRGENHCDIESKVEAGMPKPV